MRTSSLASARLRRCGVRDAPAPFLFRTSACSPSALAARPPALAAGAASQVPRASFDLEANEVAEPRSSNEARFPYSVASLARSADLRSLR